MWKRIVLLLVCMELGVRVGWVRDGDVEDVLLLVFSLSFANVVTSTPTLLSLTSLASLMPLVPVIPLTP